MAKKDNTHPILQEIKNTAKDHQAFEKERGKDLIYGHALDIASKKLVKVDWNTACAMAKKGTLSMRGEPIIKEPICSVRFKDVRDGGLLPHQIKAISRQIELGTFDSNGKKIMFFDLDPITKKIAEGTREKLKALAESGEMIDTAGMNDDEIIKAFYDVINQNKAEYTPVLIPDNETQSSSDFVAGPKKVFYSKRNPLIGEWENLLSDPNYEEIPYEIETFEEMGLWAKNRSGTLFFPTASVADLQNLSEAQMKAIESNVSTNFLIANNKAADHSFVIGRTRDAGKPFSIDDLIQQIREENPSLTEEEIAIKVYDRCHALKAINGGENFKRSFFTNLRKYGGTPIQKSKTFDRSSQDKHAKTKFSTRNR